MSSYWADTPYRQRAKPIAAIAPPTTKAPTLPFTQGGNLAADNPLVTGQPGGGFGSYGTGLDPTVLQQAWGVINPQLQSVADIINRRSQMGSGYIGGLTNYLQGQMGQISGMVGSAYGPEIKQARATANWAGQSLTGAGQAQGQNLGNVLAQAGGKQGAIAGSSDLNLTQQGKGAGGAAYGTGIAELDNLIASRAASQTRAALEPSFAAMTGQQNQSMLAAQLARQLSDQQSQIMASVPQLLLDLQNRADVKAADLRDYNERIREYNLNRQDTRSQVVGPNAPTLNGRKQYWDKVAADRTANDAQGRVWVGTNRGIKPSTDPKTGKPIRSNAWVQDQIKIVLGTSLDAAGRITPEGRKRLAALGVWSGTGISGDTAKWQASTAADFAKEQQRHQEFLDSLAVRQQNADTAVGRAAVTKAAAEERARHNKWLEQHPRAVQKTIGAGTVPRLKGGQWVTASGRVLGAGQPEWKRKQINAYWNGLLKEGYIDGQGHLKKKIPAGWAPKDYGGSSSTPTGTVTP